MLKPASLRRYVTVSALVFPLVGAPLACSSNDAQEKPDPAPQSEPVATPAPAPEAEAAPVQKSRVELAREGLVTTDAAEQARLTTEVRAQLTGIVGATYATPTEAITAATQGDHRKPGHPDRDSHRHPVETLTFFGLTPTSTVIEMGAGSGWYTELLAPVVAQDGGLIVGLFDPAGDPTSMRSVYGKRTQMFMERLPEIYGKAQTFTLADGSLKLADDNSADLVLAIREMHNWQRGGNLDAYVQSVFAALKPGGTFGVVQHRAKEGTQGEDTAASGYLAQDWLVAKVSAAGFVLEEASEINANPRDTKDYANGVWTLPPNFREGDTDRAKYEAIGESDRMTLRFKKPGGEAEGKEPAKKAGRGRGRK